MMSLRRVWLLVQEPRVVTATVSVAWLIITGIGVAALAAPPPTIAHEWGPHLTTVWGIMLTAGGALGIAGCLPGWWWIERAGIIATWTGCAMYLSIVLLLHIWGPDSGLVQAGFVTLTIVGTLARWLRISGPALDPHRGRSTTR